MEAIEEARLEKGPAFDMTDEEAHELDWPTYRHDPQRSGFSDQDLAADLPVAWETKLGGRLSAPVAAGGKVFVSSVETHTLHAIDAATGKDVHNFQGEQGFVRGTLRALVRDRRLQGFGADQPFELIAHDAGRLSLRDPATGSTIALESFGSKNIGVFARLMR